MKKILIGYMTDSLNDGINSFLKNFSEEIKDNNIQIDFITKSKDENCIISNYIKEKGFNNLYKISKNRRPIKQLHEMIRIIKKEKYDVAYFNISEAFNCVGLIAAKMCNVRKIVVHSHSSGVEGKNKIKVTFKRILNFIFRPVVKRCANSYLTCSDNAAKWLYTKDIVKNKQYEFIYNSVDYEKFKYNEDIRKKLRKELNIEDKFVIGHIGRFTYQKNHKFIIDTFKATLEKKKNSYLICIGDGEEREYIINYAKELGIDNNILFIKQVDNPQDYMQVFDIFVLPSEFEGLPIVGIEAQFSGLPYIYSDKITDEGKISKNSYKLSIDSVEPWVEQILKIEKRENELLDSASKFMKNNSKKQFERIIDENIVVEKVKKITLNLVFKILMTIHFMLNLTCFFNGFNWLVIPSFALLFFVFIFNIKNVKRFFKDKINVLLLLFLISYVSTFLIINKYNVVYSAKTFIWTVFHLFFAFMYIHIENKKQLKHEFKYLAIAIVLVMTLINIYNFILLQTGTYQVVVSLDNEKLPIGTMPWGRFYGVFYDANYASVSCVACIFLGLYLFNKSKTKPEKYLAVFSIIINLVYTLFCESRSGQVTLFIAIIVYLITRIVSAPGKIKTKVFKSFMSVAIAITIAFVLPKGLISIHNNIILNSNREIDDQTELTMIGRNDSKDISNRRFDIWKSAFEMYKDNSIIGVGFANVEGIAKDKYPNTYMVNNDLAIFTVTHNMVFDVLLSQGLVGFIIVFGIGINTLVLIIKNRKVIFNNENIEEISIIMTIVISVLISSAFLSEIFFINNACTYLFWIYFGYFNYYLNCRDKKELEDGKK